MLPKDQLEQASSSELSMARAPGCCLEKPGPSKAAETAASAAVQVGTPGYSGLERVKNPLSLHGFVPKGLR